MPFAYKSDVGQDSVPGLIALVRSSGIPYTVTSTYRPGDPLYHGKHNAIDVVSSAANMRQLAAYLFQYRPYLLELIHSNGPYFVSDGITLPTMSPRIVADHWDHVHVAATNSGLKAAGAGASRRGCLPVVQSAATLLFVLCGVVPWLMI